MKQVIHDKEVKICICGKSDKTVVRTAKRRAATWMGTTVVSVFIASWVFDGFRWEDWNSTKGLLTIGVVIYILTGTVVRTVALVSNKHSLSCSLRRAYLDVV